MAQPLVLGYKNKEIPFQLSKIERAALYGYADIESCDQDGKKCRIVTLAGDGKTIIDSGGTSFAWMTSDGEWRDKSNLTPVDFDGNTIEPVQSTFKQTVNLEHEAEIDEYLSHNIRSVYMINGEENIAELEEELKKGKIYSFPFSYRDSLEADTAFLLAGADGNIFLAIGKKTDISFIGFEQISTTEESEDEMEDDDMDFSMM